MFPCSNQSKALPKASKHWNQRAVREYTPVVESILRSGSRDTRHIEHMLDGMLDFCGHEPMLILYKKLCRHYWYIAPAATARYIQFYREMWDPESLVPSNPPAVDSEVERSS